MYKQIKAIANEIKAFAKQIKAVAKICLTVFSIHLEIRFTYCLPTATFYEGSVENSISTNLLGWSLTMIKLGYKCQCYVSIN